MPCLRTTSDPEATSFSFIAAPMAKPPFVPRCDSGGAMSARCTLCAPLRWVALIQVVRPDGLMSCTAGRHPRDRAASLSARSFCAFTPSTFRALA